MYKRNLICFLWLLWIVSLPLGAQNVLNQSLTISFEKGTVFSYLDTIQKQTGISFVYSDALNPSTMVEIENGTYQVVQLLDRLFPAQEVKYIVRGNLVVLSPQGTGNISPGKIVIRGKVVDRKENAVPFATVFFSQRSMGTITNADGEFRMVIPEEYTSDTLLVSSMGYLTSKLMPEEWLTSMLMVELTTATVPIKEVIIRPGNALSLVLASYKARKENHPTENRYMTAFFRELSKQNDEYISLSEALVEINKTSYISQADDQIRFVKGRKGTNISQSELVNLVVEGGLYNGLRLDVAKYSSYFYSEEAGQECEYRMLPTVMYKNQQTYVIGFRPKEGVQYPGYSGKLYLDSESLALVRAEFELDPSGLKYARSLLVKKTPRNYRADPEFARYTVEYRYYNQTWNLQYARTEFGIKVKKLRGKDNKGFSCNFTSSSEFVITNMADTTLKHIPFKETSRPDDVLARQVETTTPGYWLNDNVILPEEPLLQTIQRLQEKGAIPESKNYPSVIE